MKYQRQIRHTHTHWSQHISTHRLTTYHGLHQKTSFVSIRHIARLTQGLLHMMSFTVKSLCHPVVHLVGTGDVDLVALVLVGQTSFFTRLVWSLRISRDKLYCEAMVERRNCPSWLRDDDDNDDDD